MKKEYLKVRNFHRKFKQPIRSIPGKLSKERKEARYRWMLEELVEFILAKNLVNEVDGIIDLIYLALGTLVEMGVEPTKPFNLVHDANMKKIQPENPKVDKIKKPKNWKSPEPKIRKLLREEAILQFRKRFKKRFKEIKNDNRKQK